MDEASARKFYESQLNYFFVGDADGLVENQYNEDAVMVAFDNVVRGREALRDYFRGYMAALGHLEIKSTNQFQWTEDAIFLEASIVSKRGAVDVYDAWVIKDGKISYHFTGVK